MKSLEQNIYYQILTIRVALFQNRHLELEQIKKFGYREQSKADDVIRNELNRKLDFIQKDLEKQYENLEFTSGNIEEIEKISTLLLQFKEYDEKILIKVREKIDVLNLLKEKANQNLDFSEATRLREESHLLLKYFNEKKHYLNLSSKLLNRVRRFK